MPRWWGSAGQSWGGRSAWSLRYRCCGPDGWKTWRGAWQVPLGSFFVQLDALSAFFLLPILGLSTVAALYGGKYLMAYRSRKNLGSWRGFSLICWLPAW